MNLNFHRLLSYLFMPLLAVSLTFGITVWSQDVHAHKGHAGPAITFLDNKTALKAMLPNGAKIVKRKQPLKKEAVDWAQKTYGIALDDGLYSYYLASDKQNNTILGAAYVGKVSYRHGDLKFALGINADQRITEVAILGINEKYIVDFDGNVGTGLIADYAGLTLKELITKTEALSSSDKATREFAAAIRDMAVLLAAFTRVVQ